MAAQQGVADLPVQQVNAVLSHLPGMPQTEVWVMTQHSKYRVAMADRQLTIFGITGTCAGRVFPVARAYMSELGQLVGLPAAGKTTLLTSPVRRVEVRTRLM